MDAMLGILIQSLPRKSPTAYVPAKVIASPTAAEEIHKNVLASDLGSTRLAPSCEIASPNMVTESSTAAPDLDRRRKDKAGSQNERQGENKNDQT